MEVQLIKGGAISGNNKADTVTTYGTSDATITYGGDGDLWGLSLTAADVNASNFGVNFRCQHVALAVTKNAQVDQIRVQVFYTLPGSDADEFGNFLEFDGGIL
jgi:hypothetical protein